MCLFSDKQYGMAFINGATKLCCVAGTVNCHRALGAVIGFFVTFFFLFVAMAGLCMVIL